MAIGPYVVGGLGAGSSIALFILRGLYVGEVVVPDTAGLDYRAEVRRLHFQADGRRVHFLGDSRRLHYKRDI